MPKQNDIVDHVMKKFGIPKDQRATVRREYVPTKRDLELKTALPQKSPKKAPSISY